MCRCSPPNSLFTHFDRTLFHVTSFQLLFNRSVSHPQSSVRDLILSRVGPDKIIGVVLGVRTFGHVHFLELHRDKKERPLISPLFEVAKSGLGNNEAVDLCFLPTSNTVAFITERGSIYQWSSTTLT